MKKEEDSEVEGIVTREMNACYNLLIVRKGVKIW